MTDQSKPNTPSADLKMFGITKEDLVKHYGPESFNQKMAGGPVWLAASIASDVQELLAREEYEEARQLLNRMKWVLFEEFRRERETADARAEARAKLVAEAKATTKLLAAARVEVGVNKAMLGTAEFLQGVKLQQAVEAFEALGK
jgi:hypothetical protein